MLSEVRNYVITQLETFFGIRREMDRATVAVKSHILDSKNAAKEKEEGHSEQKICVQFALF